MQHEAVECVSQRPFAIFQNLRNSYGHVVEAKARRDAANVLKDPFHSFQQALLILRRKRLREALVGIGKGDGQRIPGLFRSVPVVVHELSKVHLTPSGRMVNGKE